MVRHEHRVAQDFAEVFSMALRVSVLLHLGVFRRGYAICEPFLF
jgi:hypothetical protein